VIGRDLSHHLIDPLHGRAGAEQPLEALLVACAQLAAQVLGFALELVARQRALDHQQKRVEVDRLGQVVFGACAYGGHRHGHVAERGHDDGGGLAALLAQPFQQLHAVHVRHLQIRDDKAWSVLGHGAERLLTVRCQHHRIVLLLKQFREPVAGGGFVIDNQNLRLTHGNSRQAMAYQLATSSSGGYRRQVVVVGWTL
jgi:hypothetical protein